MSFWLQYDHFHNTATVAEDTAGGADGGLVKHTFEDFQLVKFGALINF